MLHQLLTGVGEEHVVVGDAIAHRVVGAHHIEEGGEEGQGMPAGMGQQGVLLNRVWC